MPQDFLIPGLSLVANGALWYLIGAWNGRYGKATKIGPKWSNFKKIEVVGKVAERLGKRRRVWGLVGVILGAAMTVLSVVSTG